MSSLSLSWKTRAVISGRSLAVWWGKILIAISCHFGLQVKVRKNVGFPYLPHRAIASWYPCFMALALPMKLEGRITFLPTVAPVLSARSLRKSFRPVYEAACSSFWCVSIKFNRFASVFNKHQWRTVVMNLHRKGVNFCREQRVCCCRIGIEWLFSFFSLYFAN